MCLVTNNKTYVLNLSIICILVDDLSRLQAWPVSQPFFVEVGVQTLLHKSYYLINIFSMKNEVCMCNLSMKRKICFLHDGI